MLSRFDDYPIHQTPEPIAQPATSDRNAYDRYWFNGYADDGEFYFGIGMGLYPHRGILDCGLSLLRDGEQHAFHASGRAPADPSDTRVGPFRIEVVAPMRRLRVILDPNETGIEGELEFVARTASVDEGRQTLRQGMRVIMDSTRFAQLGRWQGEIRYAGQTLAIDPSRVYGTKDRSWGIRPVGEPEAGGAPNARMPQIFFLWAPLHWDDHCTHFGIFEDERGQPWHSHGAIIPAYESLEAIPDVEDPGVRETVALEHSVSFVKGTRRADAVRIALIEASGERREIDLEPLLCFRMKGIGYSHPEWGHGRWKGELAVGGESWKVSDLDPMALENQHIQQVVRARSGGRTGVGVLEQLCFGPHARYGFKEFLDGAS
jgi:hypothetical protein